MGEALISKMTKNNIVQEIGTSTNSFMSQKACTDSFALTNHTHSVSDLTSGTLSVARGGTGSTNARGALNNLGIPKESGNWTPSVNASSVSYASRSGYYERIGNMIYVFCYVTMNITNAGSDYAKVSGLPFAANPGLKAGFNLIDTGNLDLVLDSGSTAHAGFLNSWGGTNVSLSTADGSTAQKWSTGNNKYMVFSGWYVKA